MAFLWFGRKKKVKTEPEDVKVEEVKKEEVKAEETPKVPEEEKAEVKEPEKKAPAKKAAPKKTAKPKEETKPADEEKKTLIGKYLIRKTENDNFVFALKASNGENVITSGTYSTRKNLEIGIASIAKNAPIANLEDQTLAEPKEEINPKFELYKDKAGEYRFRLKARNGEIIAQSQGYTTKSACKNGIESVRKNSGAPLVDAEE